MSFLKKVDNLESQIKDVTDLVNVLLKNQSPFLIYLRISNLSPANKKPSSSNKQANASPNKSLQSSPAKKAPQSTSHVPPLARSSPKSPKPNPMPFVC